MRHGPWPGTWKVVCDVCGFQFASSDVKKRWDGLMVCHEDWELDHPQKFVRVRPETAIPAFVRAEPEPVYVTYCSLLGRQGRADMGTADCAEADFVSAAVFE